MKNAFVLTNFLVNLKEKLKPTLMTLSQKFNECQRLDYWSLLIIDHVVSVSIDFSSNSKGDVLFPCIANDYFCADWDGLCDHLTDVPWEDIFKLGGSATASEFCDWFQVEIDLYITNHIYWVMPHLSPRFSAAWATAIVHRNHIFCLH